jgi:hypothetical protein
MTTFSRETIIDRRQPQMRWSAVFAGSVLAIALWVLLQMLGMGLGLAAIDTDDGGNIRAIGIGTGIWALLVPLIAMFLGGLFAGRLASTRDARVGAMHGCVLWAVTSAIGVFAVISIISTLASGVVRAGSSAVTATTSAIGGAAQAGQRNDVASALGIDANDLLAPVNQRLREEGKPTITAEQLHASIQGVARRGLREGRFDRELFAQELARNTSLSRADVEDLAGQISDRYDSASDRVRHEAGQFADRAGQTALEVADKTGKGLLMGGLMFLLALGAAAGGGALGARAAARPHDNTVVRTTEVSST